ncbi:MAG TPA: HAD-IA family hydrolase [Anaerolineae bacterium]|nr:HAD-IA family hydrolase [Anaerolineae bacterium]
MPKIQAVIFDRDGVLTYFDFKAVMAYFKQVLPISFEELTQRWWAWRDPQSAPSTAAQEQAIFEGFWNVLAADLHLTPAQQAQLRQFDYTTIVRPFPEVPQVLQTLKRRGLRVGVLSNFELASIEASLQGAGLAAWVDVALAAPVIGVAKPDPEAYLAVARALDAPPEACLYFDDEPSWAAGARAVGMTAYTVDRSLADHDLARGIVRDLSVLSGLWDSLIPLDQ